MGFFKYLTKQVAERLGRGRRRTSGRKSAVRGRLRLEQLEDRIVPTILFTPQYGFESTTPLGGYTLSSAPVFLEFWGTYWNTGNGPQERSQIIGAAQNLFASPYFSRQTQFGTDGMVSYGNAINYNTDPTDGFSVDQIETVITTAIDNSNGLYFPRPDSTPHEALYVVITPPGIRSSQLADGGYNTLDPNHYNEVFAWVGGGTGTATNFVLDNYTTILSHEVSEAITSPGGTNGYAVSPGDNFPNPEPVGSQISDYEAQNYTARINGVDAQSYWSQQDNAFIIPDGNRQTFRVSNGTLTVQGDQLGAFYNDAIAIGVTSSGGVQVTLNGETAFFDAGEINKINVFGGRGDDTIHFGAGILGNIPVTLLSEVGAQSFLVSGSTLTLQGDQLGSPYNDSIAISQFGNGGVQATINGDTIQFDPGLITTINVNGGAGNDDIHISDDVPTLVPSIQLAATGADTLTIDRGAPTAGGTYYIGVEGRSGIGRTGWINPLFYTTNITSLTLNVQSPAHTVNIEEDFGIPITVNLGSGSDTVNISPDAENFDAAIQGVVTVNRGSGSASLNVDDQLGRINNRVLTLTGSSIFETDPSIYESNFASGVVKYNGMDSVTLNGGYIRNIIDVESTGTTTTVNAGAGSVLEVSQQSQNLDPIQGPLNLVGSGATSLTINDQFDSNQLFTQDTLTGTSLTRFAIALDPFTGLPTVFHTSSITFSGLGNLTLNAGYFETIIDVEGTAASTTVNAGANSVFEVSQQSQNLDPIQGPLNLVGSGATSLTISDQFDPNQLFTQDTLTGTSLTRFALALDPFTGLPTVFHTSSITFSGLGNLMLNAGYFETIIDVEGTAASTAVNAGANSVFEVSQQSQNLDPIQGVLDLIGSGGTPLIINDQNNPYVRTIFGARFYEVNDNNVRAEGEYIYYDGVQNLALNVGNGPNYINVYGTAAGTSTTVNGGSGMDNVTVGNIGRLDFLNGGLTVNGGGGADVLTIDDRVAYAGQNYTVTSTTASRSGTATITFSDLESLVLNGGNGGNTFVVSDMAAGPSITLNTGTGDDVVEVNVSDVGGAPAYAPLTIDGQAGNNRLVVTGADSPTITNIPKPNQPGAGVLDAIYSSPSLIRAVAYTNIGGFGATTTTQVSSDHAVSGSIYGQQVVLTAVVASGAGVPTGEVQFLVNGAAFGPAVALSGGTASLSTKALPAGSLLIGVKFTSAAPVFADSGATALAETVTPASLTITADNQQAPFGGPFPVLTVHYAGFVNGDTPASLTTPPTVATTATAASLAGGYAITASGAVDSNYAITYVSGTLTVVAPPLQVTGIVVNDGNVQRSKVNSLTVTFDSVVTLGAGAIEVDRVGGAAEGVLLNSSVVNGRTVVVVTFTGSDIVGGSLSDGDYQLVVHGGLVTGAAGQHLTGGDVTQKFFRLFGDFKGEGTVTLADLAQISGALGAKTGGAKYLWYLDYDSNGVIDSFDYLQARNRLGKKE